MEQNIVNIRSVSNSSNITTPPQTQLWIFGGGGAALEVWAVTQSLGIDLGGFVTIDGKLGFDPLSFPCLREDEFFMNANPGNATVVFGIGNPVIRKRLAKLCNERFFNSPSLIHPTVVVGPSVTIGAGTVVMAGAVLETHLSIGRHCLVNVLVSIAHNCVIGDYTNLGPGCHLPGMVQIANLCDVGTGCSFKPGVILGPETVVGAGSTVIGNSGGGITLCGSPAKPLAKRAFGH